MLCYAMSRSVLYVVILFVGERQRVLAGLRARGSTAAKRHPHDVVERREKSRTTTPSWLLVAIYVRETV